MKRKIEWSNGKLKTENDKNPVDPFGHVRKFLSFCDNRMPELNVHKIENGEQN